MHNIFVCPVHPNSKTFTCNVLSSLQSHTKSTTSTRTVLTPIKVPVLSSKDTSFNLTPDSTFTTTSSSILHRTLFSNSDKFHAIGNLTKPVPVTITDLQ